MSVGAGVQLGVKVMVGVGVTVSVIVALGVSVGGVCVSAGSSVGVSLGAGVSVAGSVGVGVLLGVALGKVGSTAAVGRAACCAGLSPQAASSAMIITSKVKIFMFMTTIITAVVEWSISPRYTYLLEL